MFHQTQHKLDDVSLCVADMQDAIDRAQYLWQELGQEHAYFLDIQDAKPERRVGRLIKELCQVQALYERLQVRLAKLVAEV